MFASQTFILSQCRTRDSKTWTKWTPAISSPSWVTVRCTRASTCTRKTFWMSETRIWTDSTDLRRITEQRNRKLGKLTLIKVKKVNTTQLNNYLLRHQIITESTHRIPTGPNAKPLFTINNSDNHKWSRLELHFVHNRSERFVAKQSNQW